MEKEKLLQMGGRKFFFGREGKEGRYLERDKIFFWRVKKKQKKKTFEEEKEKEEIIMEMGIFLRLDGQGHRRL